VEYWERHLQPAGRAPRPPRRVAEVPLIHRQPLGGPAGRALIGALNAEILGFYPEPGATHFRVDEDEVAPGRGAFVVATLDGEAVACGAVRRLDDGRAELKRMYVRPALRGRGVGAAVLDALELHARLLGARALVLETGDRLREALVLYQRAGFAPIAPWGEYADNPLSHCLGKELAPWP
jgi:GNAT superfamily N-acetyltransferase